MVYLHELNIGSLLSLDEQVSVELIDATTLKRECLSTDIDLQFFGEDMKIRVLLSIHNLWMIINWKNILADW